MTAPEPRAGLTEEEREVLSASIDRDDLPGLYGSMITAVETIIAARLAARDAEWVARLTALPDRMLDAWGGPTPWATTPSRVASLVSDWHDTLVEEMTRG